MMNRISRLDELASLSNMTFSSCCPRTWMSGKRCAFNLDSMIHAHNACMHIMPNYAILLCACL
jgi:hypothetical protein